MKYHPLLYSRTLSEDYRWILVPQGIPKGTLGILTDVYRLFDKVKDVDALRSSRIPPLLCINLDSASCLVTCGLAPYQDIHGRGIYSLQGISVGRAYTRHFWFLVPWLITHSRDSLDAWKQIDFARADRLAQHPSEESRIDFAHSIRWLAQSRSSSRSSGGRHGNLTQDVRIRLSFDEAGFTELVALLASPRIPMMNFAFGAMPGLEKLLDFPIIAPLFRQHHGMKTIHNRVESDRTSNTQQSHQNDDLAGRPTWGYVDSPHQEADAGQANTTQETRSYTWLQRLLGLDSEDKGASG